VSLDDDLDVSLREPPEPLELELVLEPEFVLDPEFMPEPVPWLRLEFDELLPAPELSVREEDEEEPLDDLPARLHFPNSDSDT
jgi:hypothetical protein